MQHRQMQLSVQALVHAQWAGASSSCPGTCRGRWNLESMMGFHISIQSRSKQNIVDVMKRGGVDFGDPLGFEEFRRQGPLSQRMSEGLKPKVLAG